MAVWNGFPKKMVLPYWMMQILGWGLGSGLLYLTFGGKITAYETANNILRGAPESAAAAGIFFCSTDYVWAGLLAEFAMTFFLLLVVYAFTDERNPNRPAPWLFPLAIGLTVSFLVMFGGALTDTALNPARDFGPRVMAWLLGWGKVAFPGEWYVYWIAPLAGGVAAGGFYKFFLSKLLCSVDPAFKEKPAEI